MVLKAALSEHVSNPINGCAMIPQVESLAAGTAAVTPQHASPEAASPPAAAVFDPELALKRCVNKSEMLQKMVQCFFDDVDNLFPQMRAALEKGDLQEVGRLGHRLKGTVVHLGAERAREAALRVEHFMLHAGDQAEAEKAVSTLVRECEVLKAALTVVRLPHGAT